MATQIAIPQFLGSNPQYRKLAGWVLLLVISAGCRSPWKQPSNQPSFDRLMEIENSNSTLPQSFQSHVNSRRPGNLSAETEVGGESELGSNAQYAQKPIGAARRRISDMDEVDLGSGEASTDQLDLLRKTQLALQNVANFEQEDSTESLPPQPRSSSRKKSPIESSDRYAVQIDDEDTDQEIRLPKDLPKLRAVPRKDRYNEAERQLELADSRRSKSRVALEEDMEESTSVKSASMESSGNDRSVRTAFAEAAAADDDAYVKPNSSIGNSKELSWQQHLQHAMKQLEKEQHEALESPQNRIRQQVISRLLSLSLDDQQGMLKPIEGLQGGEQDYFSYQLSALSDAIDPNANPQASRKWSTVMLNQRKAQNHLASISNLEINNMAFCTEVIDFGVITPFSTNKFSAGAEVLLYLELDNFVSEKARDGKGYETQLQGGYEVVDNGGRRVVEQSLPADTHICKNIRRDYFIAYRVYLPEKIKPGNYTLKLTIEDMKGHKFGQKDIAFQIQ